MRWEKASLSSPPTTAPLTAKGRSGRIREGKDEGGEQRHAPSNAAPRSKRNWRRDGMMQGRLGPSCSAGATSAGPYRQSGRRAHQLASGCAAQELAPGDWRGIDDRPPEDGAIGGVQVMDLGARLLALSLFVRDRVAQGAADALMRHLGIGPFGVATNVLRLAAVLQAATMVTKTHSGSLHLGAIFDVAMVAVFCWVCVLWSNLTAAAARQTPRPGAAIASALRRDDYLPLVAMIVAFLAWDLWDLLAGASFTVTLTTASDFIQGAGFLLGSTLWRDLPRSERRTSVVAPSPT